MGQYYKPINIDTMEWLCSHSYGNGLKLMEHSYVGNEFMGAVMTLLKKGNRWFKNRIVWCGDYYDEEGETPYYDMVKNENELEGVKPMTKGEQQKCILVNFTRREYVDFRKLVSHDGWVINPLSLLTACGNDRGGGDYRSGCADYDKVGIWKEDSLGILTAIPYGFWELKVGFSEVC
jgi:hypothetical protein